MDVADNTVALVTKHCGLQLELYQKCVTQNPANWDLKCITQKRALAKCSEDKYAASNIVIPSLLPPSSLPHSFSPCS